MVEWNKKYTESEVEILLEQAKTIKLSIGGLGIHSIIASALDFHEDIFFNQAEKLVNQAIKVVGRSKLNRINFLEEINKQEKEHLKFRKQELHIVTDISINPRYSLRPISFEDIDMRFYEKVPIKYKRTQHVQEIERILHNSKLPPHYKTVVIKLHARSGDEAALKALECLDFIIGTWNFQLNFYEGKKFFFGANKQLPINKIVKGPLHTIHLQNGESLPGNLYYYEPDYYGPVESFHPAQFIVDMKKIESHFKRRIKYKKSWGTKIKNSIIRYSRALEKFDHTTSFLDLWNILEYLTGTSSSENYNVTIRRISNLYVESELYKSFVNFIRHIRNSLVHQSEFNTHRTNITYEIKQFVEHLILYHLSAINDFDNFDEAIQFLDFPNNADAIKRRIKLLKKFHETRFGKKAGNKPK